MKFAKLAALSTLLTASLAYANGQYKEIYPAYDSISIATAKKSIKLPKGTTFVSSEFDGGLAQSYLFDKERIYPTENKSGKQGVVNAKGNTILPTKYDSIHPLTYDLFTIYQNNKAGVIDRTQKVIIPLQYDHIEHIDLKDNLVLAVKNQKYGFINLQNKTVIPFNNSHYILSSFSEGLAAFVTCGKSDCDDYNDLKLGYIDKTGKVVIPAQYDFMIEETDISFQDQIAPHKFKNGLAIVQKFTYTDDYEYPTGSIYGYINKTGNLVINYQFDYASAFGETIDCYNSDNGTLYKKVQLPPNQAMVHKNEKHYIIDTTGKTVKAVKFDKHYCPIL